MKQIFETAYANRHFLMFILLFAYFESVYKRIVISRIINVYIFTPESAFASLISVCILFLILLFFIRNWKKSNTLGLKELLKIFGASLVTFLILMKMIGFVIAFSFDTIERNFNQETFILSLFSDLLEGIIYGSFFLVYYFYHQNIKKQKQLIAYNEAISESKIKQLKSQLNPHFLFNNLNVLDQLIEEDKNKASEFLNEFADIYRYVLQSSDKKFVTINEELIFAEHYFRLIHHKYRDAYQLEIESKGSEGYIAPLTIQMLIENAVQHNLGTVKSPIYIKIDIQRNIDVTNNRIPKRNVKLTSGRALNNLKDQYKLLTNSPIVVAKTDASFSVTVPIIQKLIK